MASSLRRCAALVVALLAVAVAAAGPGTSHASPTWVSDVVDLSPRGGYAQGPQVALDASGNAVAVWTQQTPDQSTYLIRAATRPAGGSWSRPVILSDGKRISIAPQVAVTPDGDAFAVWQHNDKGVSVIQASYRSAGGTWTDAVDVSADGGFASEPRLAVEPDGTALVAWHRDGVAQVSSRRADGTWRAPVTVSAGGDRVDSVGIAAGADTGPLVVWRAFGAGRARVEAVTRRVPGWGEPVTISDGEDVLEIAGPPEVAMDAQGNAVVVWYQGTMFSEVVPMIRASERTPEGSWAPPTTLSGASGGANNPVVAVDPSGGAVVAWDAGSGTVRTIVVATKMPDHDSWATQSLSDPTHLSAFPHLAFGTGGTAVVIWGEATSFGLPSILHASTRVPGEAWSAPADLSDPAVQPVAPRVAVDRDGNALAVWQGLDGEHATIQSRGFDGVGPALSAFRPTLRGAVHMPLRYSARARDAWSGVRKVVWTFGDGHRATGRRVEHRFRRPGVYRVRVTTSDRLGNVSVKRARTRVTRR